MADDYKKSIGAFWQNTSKAGMKYMSGNLEDADGNKTKVVLFKNSHKQEGENTPDWRLYESEPQEGGASKEKKEEAEDDLF